MQRLPHALIDQIAAGEVVERPASVVKELVENALDAGAQRVRVEVREGGAALVAVTDDGWGMTRDDARLALERHATSKLTCSEDLTRILSFGFRGEALPAIASVSRLRLRSRPRGSHDAVEIAVDHGQVLEERTAAGPEGTRVEVADLFAGVPARRKFLKRSATEWGHVADWLTRAALALPGVHFDVRRDDREALAWPAAEALPDRVASVLGERESTGLIHAEGVAGALSLHALVSRPDIHRASASMIYGFVNGRPVRDRLLRHALLEAYRDWLPRGRFPTALVYLTVPPEAVDVNVHPAKWEVRFADPRAVHELVRRALREAIGGRSWLAPVAEAARQTASAPARPGAADRVAEAPASGASDWLFARDREAPPETEPGARSQEPLRFADHRLLGQLLGTYLLLEGKGGLLLLDQHAGHERVLYERLREGLFGAGVERQALLIAETIELAASEAAALEAHADAALRLGFELEPFGESAVLVRAMPALLADRDPGVLVRQLAAELATSEGARAGGAELRRLDPLDRLVATLACHAARRAGDVLDPREQAALLTSLDAIPWAPTCPHGRPVAVPLPLAEIERRFGRR